MKSQKSLSIFYALMAALLFGSSAPVAKLLLGNIEPIPLASFLYLGSGTGMFILKIIQHFRKDRISIEAGIKKKDIKWLIGAVFAGGVIAPIILMFSLMNTPATTASLLLNFEGVATTLIAALLFKEAIGKRVWLAVALITSASILLSLNINGEWGFTFGALGILTACVMWGLDNNFSRNISAKDPVTIVFIKGIGAGLFSLLLALILGNVLPDFIVILMTMALGFVFYGLSILFFILAMRGLGSARTSAFFGTAPFAGVLLSLILFRDEQYIMFFISIPIMIIGAILLLSEKHGHSHIHERLIHEHRHTHSDRHHIHSHDSETVLEHSHTHTHEEMQHSHQHTPDTHHRHKHK